MVVNVLQNNYLNLLRMKIKEKYLVTKLMQSRPAPTKSSSDLMFFFTDSHFASNPQVRDAQDEYEDASLYHGRFVATPYSRSIPRLQIPHQMWSAPTRSPPDLMFFSTNSHFASKPQVRDAQDRYRLDLPHHGRFVACPCDRAALSLQIPHQICRRVSLGSRLGGRKPMVVGRDIHLRVSL